MKKEVSQILTLRYGCTMNIYLHIYHKRQASKYTTYIDIYKHKHVRVSVSVIIAHSLNDQNNFHVGQTQQYETETIS